jgi:hypothetical protein
MNVYWCDIFNRKGATDLPWHGLAIFRETIMSTEKRILFLEMCRYIHRYA